VSSERIAVDRKVHEVDGQADIRISKESFTPKVMEPKEAKKSK